MVIQLVTKKYGRQIVSVRVELLFFRTGTVIYMFY
jgi:hypothetical protein